MYKFLPFLIFSIFSISVSAQDSGSSSCSALKSKAQNHKPTASPDKVGEMNNYDVKYHKLDLEVSNSTTYISGTVTTKAQVTNSGFDKFVFELHPSLTVDSIIFNGTNTAFQVVGTTVEATISPILNQGDFFTAIITYHGLPTSTGSAAIGSGITNDQSPTWGNHVTWTLSQPYSAYEWWPCKQALADKIDSLDVFLTTADSLRAGSNGLLVNVASLPGNKIRYEWKERYPISYYLVSFSVAKYVQYVTYAHPNGPADSTLVLDYIYNNPQTLNFFQDSLDQTAQFINHFSTIFGPYYFANEKYGHCMAPLGGGMEHQTMTTQGSFNFSLTSHELTHQWFGDNVTCTSWKDIWVNEGFATYGTYLAYEHFRPGSARVNMDDNHNSVLSQLGGSTYVDDTVDVGRIFDYRLTYQKGSAIIHSLRFVINNDSIFFAGLKKYQHDYSMGNAYGEDFKGIMEQVSGLNLTQFFDQWYYGQGYPTVSARWNQSNGMVYLKLNQTASMANVTPFFFTPFEIKFTSSAGDTTVRFDFNQNGQLYSFQFSHPINTLILDPNQWILNVDGPVIKDTSLGIWEVNTDQVYIYPNPVIDRLLIKNISNGDLIQISDMNGKVIYSRKATANQEVIASENWAKGVYQLNIVRPSGNIRGKIVKQ